MADDYIARKQGGWKVVSLAPDVCKTPMGSSTPPVPYPVTAELAQSGKTAATVRANGHELVLFDASLVSKTLGDAAGSAKGVKSGTVGAASWPKGRSSSVFVQGKPVVRHDDEFWMNGSHGGNWTIAELLKVLCPKDKDVVDDLAETDVYIADDIYYDDLIYDGSQWTVDRFPGGGSWGGDSLLMLATGSAQAAATTAYHELIHKHQDPSMSWQAMEEDAYYRTEAWAIERGMPAPDIDGFEFRTTKADGALVPNRDDIERFVQETYPIPADPNAAFPVGVNASGDVQLSDGTTRPPERGDRIAGQEEPARKRKVPRSVWKCPGESDTPPEEG